MSYEEYLQKIEELENEFENKKIKLMYDFIEINNLYKIGDKVTDNIGTILIEKIVPYRGYFNKPCAVYIGVELKKDGTPNKKGNKRKIWQSNVI